MLRKTILAACVLLPVLAAPAEAQQYPPDSDAVCEVSASSASVGETITVACGGYLPNSKVDFTLFSTPVFLGAATADSRGVVSMSFEVPEVSPGTHRIEAVGTGADGQPLVQSVTFTVVGGTGVAGAGTGGAGADGTTGGLARTGADNEIVLAQAALAMVAVGGVLLVVARKRRSSRTQVAA